MANTGQETGATDGLVANYAGWPDGWYVYEDGKVQGPFSAGEAFALESESSDGKPRLISRKGFSQWYTLKDLASIFKMTADMGRRAESASMPSVPVTTPRAAASSIQSVHTDAVAPKVVPRKIQTQPDVVIPPFVPPSDRPAAQASAVLSTAKEQALPRNSNQPERASATGVLAGAAATVPAGSSTPATTAPAVDVTMKDSPAASPTGTLQPKAVAGTDKKEVLHEYFLCKGRLRLGKMRNPWISALVGLPLSLGLLWAVWFGELAREAHFHAHNENRNPIMPGWLALIPGLHIFCTYRLAKVIAAMEQQNKYRNVQPGLAAMFSLLPPVAMIYLQDAMNRHWLLHARHAVIRKQAQAG